MSKKKMTEDEARNWLIQVASDMGLAWKNDKGNWIFGTLSEDESDEFLRLKTAYAIGALADCDRERLEALENKFTAESAVVVSAFEDKLRGEVPN
jgi:hypothetical protein